MCKERARVCMCRHVGAAHVVLRTDLYIIRLLLQMGGRRRAGGVPEGHSKVTFFLPHLLRPSSCIRLFLVIQTASARYYVYIGRLNCPYLSTVSSSSIAGRWTYPPYARYRNIPGDGEGIHMARTGALRGPRQMKRENPMNRGQTQSSVQS